MWIYWKEQCNYCSNYENCSYYNKAQELISKLDNIEQTYDRCLWNIKMGL